MSAGSAVTTACGTAPAPLAPSGAVLSFIAPANTGTWFIDAATKAGIGFSGAASLADEQFVKIIFFS